MNEKTAVICLAYLEKPSGVALLAEFFAQANADLFIHVDAKSQDTAYQAVAREFPNVRLVNDRYEVFWGGFNTIRAMVSSLNQARHSGVYSRFLIITEDTVPIISRDEFQARMAWDGEFIESKLITSGEVLSRYAGFFYLDSFSTTPRPCRTAQRVVTDRVIADIERLRTLQLKGKAEISEIFHGSVWSGLTSSSIYKILDSYETDLHLRESFEFSAVPEEQYFHTILGALPRQAPLVFADWSRRPTPYVFQSAQDIEEIDSKSAIFLRKVVIGSQDITAFVRQRF